MREREREREREICSNNTAMRVQVRQGLTGAVGATAGVISNWLHASVTDWDATCNQLPRYIGNVMKCTDFRYIKFVLTVQGSLEVPAM